MRKRKRDTDMASTRAPITVWKSKRTYATAGITVAAMALAACGSSATPTTGTSSTAAPSASASGQAASTHYHFELITKSNASPYWLAVKAGADAAAAKLGDTVSFEAPASGTDLSTQISMFNNAVTTHVDGIILAAQQPQPLSGPVAAAVKAGVPVVTVDSGVTPTTSDSFIATSNTKAAASVCEYGAKLAGGKGSYGIIDFNEISSTGRARPAGCQQGMAKYPGFKYVGMQISNNSIATGKAETEAMLTSHPSINLMFGANDRAALGVAEGVQALGKTKQVTVIGFDADLGEVPLIANGTIKGSLLQSPYTMGYQALQELVSIKAGKSVPKRVDTGTYIVTPQNVSSTTAKQYLAQYGAATGVAP
jgi:ribose transport system substrate-binding protein